MISVNVPDLASNCFVWLSLLPANSVGNETPWGLQFGIHAGYRLRKEGGGDQVCRKRGAECCTCTTFFGILTFHNLLKHKINLQETKLNFVQF
jgi:hypothetical protein